MGYDDKAGRNRKGEAPPTKVTFSPQALSPDMGYLPVLMIRLFTIFCKLNQISFSDRQWLEMETAGFCACDAVCPVCGTKGCLAVFAHYDRYLVEMRENRPVVHTVRITRCRCSSCGHTHAAHSSCLVPYRSYSLRFILHVLRHYFLHHGTVEQLCRCYGISPSTLYAWKALFQKQKRLWPGVLKDMAAGSLSFLEALDGKLIRDFQQAFRSAFLERFPVTDREMLFSEKKKKSAIT